MVICPFEPFLFNPEQCGHFHDPGIIQSLAGQITEVNFFDTTVFTEVQAVAEKGQFLFAECREVAVAELCRITAERIEIRQ